jgi:BolA protein
LSTDRDTEDRRARLEAALQEAFAPDSIEVTDESHRHDGHPGAASGGGHFRVVLVSDRFEGRTRIERHRMVYEALGDWMGSEIHALALETRSPSEQRGA